MNKRQDSSEKWLYIAVGAALVALCLAVAAIEVSKNLRPPATQEPTP